MCLEVGLQWRTNGHILFTRINARIHKFYNYLAFCNIETTNVLDFKLHFCGLDSEVNRTVTQDGGAGQVA